MKVLFFSGKLNNAMSFYRGAGVLNELTKLDQNIRIVTVPTNGFNMEEGKGFDVAYFHRPDQEHQVNAIKTLKKMKIPVIVDYDDDFTTCPETSPYNISMTLHEVDYLKNVCDALLLADTVIVSTLELKKQYQIFNSNIHIVPNAFDNYFLDLATEFNKSKIVYWRGGDTHKQDLFVYKSEIEKLIDENEDFQFIFHGKGFPEWLKILSVVKQKPNLVLKGITTIFNYFWQLQELKAGLVIVPLEDNQFNKSKSNIAAIEAVTTGALTLTPNWEEWNWNNLTYTNQKTFYEQASSTLARIREKDELLKIEWKNNIEYIEKNRLLTDINKIRLNILKSVLKYPILCHNTKQEIKYKGIEIKNV